MTMKVARITVFQEIRPGAGSKTSDFVKEILGVCRKTTYNPAKLTYPQAYAQAPN